MNVKVEVSVIICAYNARNDHLDRVLDALQKQTLSMSRWDLVLVDNNSKNDVARLADLSWHPDARLVHEGATGLSHARIKGIQCATGNLLLFVDQDNVLREDYMEEGLKIATARPYLGAWSGRILGEFEVDPPKELTPYLGKLNVRDVQKEAWSNSDYCSSTPYGSGLFIRRDVAEYYFNKVSKDPRRLGFGRAGDHMGTMEDIDMVTSGIELGYGSGLFPTLELLHLMPKERLNLDFLLRLFRDAVASEIVYLKLKNLNRNNAESFIDHLVMRYKYYRANRIDRLFEKARLDGLRLGEEKIRILGI
jgi:glycosyltransferase involved in cell wall biosynthesis